MKVVDASASYCGKARFADVRILMPLAMVAILLGEKDTLTEEKNENPLFVSCHLIMNPHLKAKKG